MSLTYPSTATTTPHHTATANSISLVCNASSKGSGGRDLSPTRGLEGEKGRHSHKYTPFFTPSPHPIPLAPSTPLPPLLVLLALISTNFPSDLHIVRWIKLFQLQNSGARLQPLPIEMDSEVARNNVRCKLLAPDPRQKGEQSRQFVDS